MITWLPLTLVPGVARANIKVGTLLRLIASSSSCTGLQDFIAKGLWSKVQSPARPLQANFVNHFISATCKSTKMIFDTDHRINRYRQQSNLQLFFFVDFYDCYRQSIKNLWLISIVINWNQLSVYRFSAPGSQQGLRPDMYSRVSKKCTKGTKVWASVKNKEQGEGMRRMKETPAINPCMTFYWRPQTCRAPLGRQESH